MNNRDNNQNVIQRNTVSIIKNPGETRKNILIEVTNQKGTIVFQDRKAYSFFTNIIVDGKTIPLHSINYNNRLKLSSNKHYNILFKYSYLDNEIEVKLPKLMCENLLKFLTTDRRENECCMDLINDLYFGCQTAKLNHIHYKVIMPIKNNENVAIGQTVSIGNNNQNKQYRPNHFAIYLGGDLYLSVMGTNIPLLVTTLKQMKLIYNDKKAVMIEPLFDNNSTTIASFKI